MPAGGGDVGGGADVQVHLHRRGAAHHRAPGIAVGVEVVLHRVVAGRRERAAAVEAGVEAESDETHAVVAQLRGEQRGVGGERRARGADALEGRRAELDLAAGLEREPAPGGELGAGRADDRDGDAVLGGVGAHRQPLDLDADPGRRARREAAGGDERADVVDRDAGLRRRHAYRCP